MKDDIDTILKNFCDDYKLIRKYKYKPYVLFKFKRLTGLLNTKTKNAFCWGDVLWNKDEIFYSDKMWQKVEDTNKMPWNKFWCKIGESKEINKMKNLNKILEEIKLCQI